MAILIQDAVFTTAGVPLGLTDLYIDVMVVFPHGTQDAQARLQPYAYQDGQKADGPLAQVDGVRNFSFSPLVLVKDDFWNDINAGNAHDYVILQLETEQPQWAGKITKIVPNS